MVAGMNSSMTHIKYIRYATALMMFVLAVPAHALVENESGARADNEYYGLILGRNDENRRNDQYQLKKNHKKENRKKGYMSLDDSSEKVRRSINGRVLSAQPYESEDSTYHRVKILTPEGVVRTILVNPETGEFD